MPKVFQHDLAETVYNLGEVALGTSGGTIVNIPLAQSGQAIRFLATKFGATQVDDAVLTFQVGGNLLQANAGNASLTLAAADPQFGTKVIEFSSQHVKNFIREAEDGDAAAAGVTLRVLTDGGNSVDDSWNFVFVSGR